MQDATVGPALNYGQSGQPKKSRFMNYQYDNYGIPSRERTAPQGNAGRPAPPPVSTAMPNGMPAPEQATPQPQAAAAPVKQQEAPPQQAQQNEGVYTPGQIPQNTTYNPAQVQQFNYHADPQLQQQMSQMMGSYLQNPYSLGPDTVNQMKGQMRDQAALMQQQQSGQLRQMNAGRGVANNMGYGAAQQRQLGSDVMGGLLGNYNNLDIQAAQSRMGDMRNALQLGNEFQNNNLQQALGVYGAQLQGQQAQSGENQAGINSNLQNYQLGEQGKLNQANSIQQMLARQMQGNQFNQQFGENQRQFNIGQDFNNRQFDASQNQWNQHFGLQNKQFDASQNQFDKQFGLQQQQYQSGLNQWDKTFGLQQQQFGEGVRQFDKNYDFNNRQFDWTKQYQGDQLGMQGAGIRQADDHFNQQMAFQYQQADQQQMQALLAAIMGGGGGY